MKLLLLTGLGPVWPAASSFWDSDALAQTFFQRKNAAPFYHEGLGRALGMADFRYRSRSGLEPLFRLRLEGEPHLTTATLGSILDRCGREYEAFDLEHVWSGGREPSTAGVDVVALSTTFICNRRAMNFAVNWVSERYPDATLVVGGQYSNLKYMRLMRDLPAIDYVVRGDAEAALPMLLDALEGKADLGKVPNLVVGGPGKGLRSVKVNEFEYVDLERHPSPGFRGRQAIVPYESMRGCPFTCKFCSFPFASPKWRYKSGDKIVRDWANYVEENGASLVRALDSTFTVPVTRFEELLEKLPGADIRWEAYTRANVIKSAEIVASLEASRCATLSIGFESMSESSLKHMDKKVHAWQNRRAHELLSNSAVDFRGSFIIGYPGETPDDFEETFRFLVDEYSRRFMVNVFSLTDETMPVWDDAEAKGLEVGDPNDPDSDWKHKGMDVATARQLHRRTLREVRWKNERAVAALWQMPYQLPLIPGLGLRENYRVEKLLERLAFAPRDFADDPGRAGAISREAAGELAAFGVEIAPAEGLRAAAGLGPLAPRGGGPKGRPSIDTSFQYFFSTFSTFFAPEGVAYA